MLKFFKGATQKNEERLSKAYRAMIHREAGLGSELFGEVNKGVRREFFCLDERTWVWHEEWTDEKGQRQIVTTRYDIRPDTILKAQNDRQYQEVSDEEAQRLCQAAHLYVQRVRHNIYHTA